MPSISPVQEAELHALYAWVDEIPLSRPKKSIARDFSDGVLTAEIIAHFFPRAVELHNYSGAHSIKEKLYNWNTLNVKVFKKMGFTVPESEVKAVVEAQPGAIERILKLVKSMIERHMGKGDAGGDYSFSPVQKAPAAELSPGLPARAPVTNPARAAQQQNPAPYLGQTPAAAVPQRRAAEPPGALAQKDAQIMELRQTNEILETKVRKLEQLVRLKDAKIQTLIQKLQGVGLS